MRRVMWHLQQAAMCCDVCGKQITRAIAWVNARCTKPKAKPAQFELEFKRRLRRQRICLAIETERRPTFLIATARVELNSNNKCRNCSRILYISHIYILYSVIYSALYN